MFTQHPASLFRDKKIIFDTYPDLFIRQIEARLNGDHVPRLEHRLAGAAQAGRLVQLEPEAVTRTVKEAGLPSAHLARAEPFVTKVPLHRPMDLGRHRSVPEQAEGKLLRLADRGVLSA